MQTLQIDEKKAKGLYKTAPPEFKAMLIDTFGEKFFSEKITDRVKSFEDACELLDVSANDVVPFEGSNLTIEQVSTNAFAKLATIAKALNEGWKPDWNNANQYKWYPWFYLNKPGFRFDVTRYVFTDAVTSGGSRLCFHSRELAEFAGNHFLDLYSQLLN